MTDWYDGCESSNTPARGLLHFLFLRERPAMPATAADPLSMSVYIVSLAAAARAAQAVMSTGADPMQISEFRFKANIASEFTVQSETSAELKIWRLDLKQKITIGYKAEWGLEIECKIVPVV